MQYRLMVTLLVALSLSVPTLAENSQLVPGSPDCSSLVRLYYTDRSQLLDLVKSGADIATHRKGYVEVVIPPTRQLGLVQPELAQVLARFGRREVLCADLDARVREATQQPNLGIYHTLDEVKTELEATATQYPQIAKLTVAGQSVEGRPIWAMRIGSAPDGAKPAFLFVGLTHAREWISVEVVMGLISTLTKKYASDPKIRGFVDEREIWIVPVVNPDGLSYSQTQATMWRKNRRKNDDGSYGVDLNRNFGYKWGGEGSSPSPTSDTYRGPSAFSEPCTRAVRDLAKARKVVTALSFHSYSELILWPWGYTADQTPDADVFVAHGQKMAEINGYTPEQSIELYATTGDFDDYMYGELSALTYTIELGKEFIPDEAEVPGIVEKNVKCCLYLLENTANPFPLLAHSQHPATTDASGPYTVPARIRIAGHTGFAVQSLDLFHKAASDESFTSVPMQPVAGSAEQWQGTIPGAGYTTHSYYFHLVGNDGRTYRFPETGTYSFKVVEKLWLVVADDGGAGYEKYYSKALEAAGADHTVWRVKKQGPVTRTALFGATGCIWFTGTRSSDTLSADDQKLVTEYMAAGGRLILFGEDIGYELKNAPFYRDQLHAKYVTDTSSVLDVVGTGPLAGFAGNIGGSADSVKQQYPDVIQIVPPAAGTVIPIVTYGPSGQLGALAATTSKSMLAYFGFGLEGVGGEANRSALMKKLLDWMTGQVDGALARSEAAARAGARSAHAASLVASGSMDEELAERVFADISRGDLAGAKALAARVGAGDAHASRVARVVIRLLGTAPAGVAAEARQLLGAAR